MRVRPAAHTHKTPFPLSLPLLLLPLPNPFVAVFVAFPSIIPRTQGVDYRFPEHPTPDKRDRRGQ
jgi:hypothetical protein